MRQRHETIQEYANRLGTTRTNAAFRHGFETALEQIGVHPEDIEALWADHGQRLRNADGDAGMTRSEHIWEAINAGATRVSLAKEYGVTRARIAQLYDKERRKRYIPVREWWGGPIVEWVLRRHD